MDHTCNSSSQEAEAGKSKVLGQPGVHCDFKAALNYVQESVLTENKKKRKKKPILLSS